MSREAPARSEAAEHNKGDPAHAFRKHKSPITLVDLVGAYSKRSDLADQLQRLRRRLKQARRQPTKDRQQSPRTTAKAEVPRRVVDRLGEDVVREIVEARRAGVKLRNVAERYGISESSVKRLLRPTTKGPEPVDS